MGRATKFLPAELDSAEEIRRQRAALAGDLLLGEILDAMPVVVLLLNERRQILHANLEAREVLGRRLELLVGRRPGDALGCVHATVEGVCGTVEACTVCGAAVALACALGGRTGAGECRIPMVGGRALVLRVRATPLRRGGQPLILLAAVDISDEKRRAALERVFFHDALNMVGAVRGLAELLPGADKKEVRDCSEDIVRSAQQLVDEITSQRDLASAESGELRVEAAPCPVRRTLEGLAGVYRAHDAARGRRIEVAADLPPQAPVTSRVLLTRVLGNLLKNALEAEPRGAVVALGCERLPDGRFSFWVRNPSVMPRRVQLQVFVRSFSTKDPARGLGTYGAKLLTERYLGGAISFRSEAGFGTEFRVVLPAVLRPAGSGPGAPAGGAYLSR